MSNFTDILGALTTAVEAITPGVNPLVTFKRWRGDGILGSTNSKQPPAHRAFQWQAGPALTPIAMSGASDASTWLAMELRLVVAYQPNLGRRETFDSADHGHILEVTDDREKLHLTLVLGNPVSSSSYHLKRIRPLDPWEDSSRPQYRTYRFRLDYTLA